MRLKLAIWGIIVVAVAGTLLAAAPATLKAARLHWPAWPVALAAALITALAGLVKPLTIVITQSWANRAQRQIERRDRARQIETDVTGHSKGLPLAGQITDRALLGIHPAIPLPAGADPGLPFDLPLYIPRDIDAELHAWITAHQQTGGFLLLTGPAAAGKTRTAYELIRSTLSDWPLYMPGTPDQLISYINAGGPSTGKLIIWLNEIQNYLSPGGLTAAATRRILAGPPAAIIIGTIWPERYDTLTSLPALASAPADDAVSDPRGDAREILTILADRKDLRSAFTPGERHRAERLAPVDPRIAEALCHADSPTLPETLAAVPDLISRWLTAADPYGAAVIIAAVTARRCGHPPLLPPDLLQTLAQAALTPAQRARAQPEWFTAALAWARTPVRGQAAPLTPQATTPAVIEGDHVSDVLIQHAASEPTAPWHQVPEPIWLLLISQAAPLASAYIASTARRHMHVHQAPITMRAIRKAADAGILQAMSNLAFLLYEQGDTEQAIHWFTKAADADNQSAMSNLGILLYEQGDTEQARHWLSKAVGGDDPAAMYNFGVVLDKQGDTEQAEH